jgi:hypothetical protein
VIAHDRAAKVFYRGLRDGADALGLADRERFRIQDFIIDYEMDGLSGSFYNRLPDLTGVQATVAAMRQHGLAELAALLTGMWLGYGAAVMRDCAVHLAASCWPTASIWWWRPSIVYNAVAE